MTASITRETRIFNADNFIKSFIDENIYVFIGKDSVWDSEPDPDIPLDNVDTNRLAYNDLLGMKIVNSANVVPVIQNFAWTNGEYYARYDDQDTSAVVTITIDGGSQQNSPFYVVNSNFEVFKCIDYNVNGLGEVQASTIEPLETAIDVEGYTTGADGYTWKYMYTMSLADCNFKTDEWAPVISNTSMTTVEGIAVSGEIRRMRIVDGGTGYLPAEAITLTDANGASFAAEVASIGVSGEITAITITNVGSGYHDVTAVTITTAGGADAVLEPVYSPLGGHGSNAREELFSLYAMARVTLDSDESGVLTVPQEFRKMGLIVNPLLTQAAASGIKLTVSGQSGGEFSAGDVVDNSGGASGTVVKYDRVTGELWLTSVVSTFSVTNTIDDVGSKTATVDAIESPTNVPATASVVVGTDVEFGSGNIIYIEHREYITRNSGQSEEIKLVVEF